MEQSVGMLNRYVRQQDIVPRDKIEASNITIIGVGAVGRQVALQLSAIGIKKMTLIDFDTVAEENLAPQGFLESDIGLPKVIAVSSLCRQINGDAIISTRNDKFKGSDFEPCSVVFCCVDSIDTRKIIFNNIKNKCTLFIDSRMSAESFKIFSVFDNKSREFYPSTIFPEVEAFRGSCTAKSTIYTASILAGMMISNFTKWLRNIPIEQSISLNMLTNEMWCG